MQHRFIIGVNLVLIRGEHVLLGLRHNTSWANGHWYFPAGRLEHNESVLSGVAREAREELAIDIRRNDLTLCHILHHTGPDHGRGWLQLFFTASGFSGSITNAEPSLCKELRWWPRTRLPEPCAPYVDRVLSALDTHDVLTVLAARDEP
ncbi:NUDIX domain-containing protein [Streptomyces sp. NPDC055103]